MNKIQRENRELHGDKLKRTVEDLLTRDQQGYAILLTIMAMGSTQEQAEEYVRITSKEEEYIWSL